MQDKEISTLVKIDCHGRTRLPKTVREALGIEKGDKSRIFKITISEMGEKE